MTTRRRDFVQRRKACGYTQESFARALEVDRTTVQRWERGAGDPQPYLRPKIARALEVATEELDALLFPAFSEPSNGRSMTEWAVPSENGAVRTGGHHSLHVGGLDEMMRREFLRLTSTAGAIIPAAEIGVVADEVSSTAFSNDIDGPDRVNAHLWRVFSLSSVKSAVYPAVRQQLHELTQRLKRAKTQNIHRQLCAATGDLFQLAGEIAFDGNRYTEAAHCYALAASASREAGSYDLWACALTRHAFIGMYEHRFAETLPLLDAAERVARRGDSQMSTRYWVSAVRAEVLAKAGDFRACDRALHEAEEVRSLNGRVSNGGWLRFDGSRLAEERGTCYAALGRPNIAEAALRDALKQPLSPRRRSGVLTDLAVLGVQRRDIDQFVSYAQAVIELAQQTRSGYIGGKLQVLQGQLDGLLADRRVAQLREQLSAFVNSPI